MSRDQERPSTECPDESRWLALVGSSIDSPDREIDLAHATHCALCAARLRLTTALLGEPVSESEETTLNDLRSSSPQWQTAMAKKMDGTSAGEKARAPIPIFRSRYWLLGSLAAALLLAAGLILILARHRSEERLLAEAYSTHRTTELRLGAGEPGEVATTLRGSAGPESTELLELKLRAAEHLKQHPNDARWHQLLGQVNLLEHDGEAARVQFQLTRVLDPSAPDLRFHEGLAYFELAETHKDNVFYARAAECFSEILQAPGQLEASARFDRGLSYQRQNLYSLAAADYEAALRLEKDKAWRKEIQAHLESVRSHKGSTEPDHTTDHSPETFLAGAPKPYAANDQYESRLDTALTDWLPERAHSATVEQALTRLSETGLQHGDALLSDWLHFPASLQERIADKHLARAISAALAGHTDALSNESRTAFSLYRQLSNKPGTLRARAAMMYALQRTGRNQECLAGVSELLRERAMSRYSWLHAYLLLEGSACAASLGDQVASIKFNRQALAMAERYDLPLQALRARGFLAEDLMSAGQVRLAWSMNVSGLHDCAGRSATSMRRYQFLYNLGLGATQLDLPLTASAFYDAAVEAASITGNTQISAYAFEGAGVSHLAAQQPDQAAKAFQSATNLLVSLPSGIAATLYRADWEAERSAMLAARGERAAALERMSVAERSIAPTTTVYVKQPFYTRYAELLLDDRQPALAKHYAELAVREANAVLATDHAHLSRRAWSQEARPAYVALVEGYLDNKDPEAALWAWERYRSASTVLNDSHALSSGQPSAIARPSPGEATLVFARLRSDYVVWIVPPDPALITFLRLAAKPGYVDQLVKTFRASCANPQSPSTDLDLMGIALYQDLLAPLVSRIGSVTLLRLHLDGALKRLPFDALVQPDHTLLLQRYRIAELSDGWAFHPAGDTTVTSAERALVVEGAPGAGSRFIASRYNEGPEIARMFSGVVLLSAQEATAKRLEAELPQTQLFHYAGHWKNSPVSDTSSSDTATALLTPALLSVQHLQRCRLAVLAACQTGEADEDGLPEDMSLADTMIAGGAAQVVASGWDVDSSATQQLMLAFYTRLLKHQPTATALQAAKQLLRDSPTTRHPYYWSAFQLLVR